MSLPPRFAFVPATLFSRSDVPIHLRWSYAVLYAMAWRHDYDYVSEDYAALAALFSEIEAQEITPRGMRERIQQMAEFGLVERRQVGRSQWRTYLLLRHDAASARSVSSASYGNNLFPEPCGDNFSPRAGQGDAAGVEGDAVERHPPPEGDAPGVTLDSHIVVDVVVDPQFRLDDQQQQLFVLLTKIGVSENAARDLVQAHDPQRVAGWVDYAVRHWQELSNPPGFVRAMIERRVPLIEPYEPEEDLARFRGGRYAEFVES